MLIKRLLKTAITLVLICSISLTLMGGVNYARAEELDATEPEPVSVEIEPVELNLIELDSRVLDPIEQFVERMYKIVLNREPEEQGLIHWSGILKSRRMTGAQVAHAFFFCPEFISRGVSERTFVIILYETLMDREPSEWEIQHWLHHIWLGWPLDNVFSAFVHSAEFGLRCQEAGINQGTFVPPTGGMARVFATRLYRTALGREPDVRGLDSWHNLLRTGSVTGASAAFSFLFSQELRSQNISNTEFIRRIYLTMMGREPDEKGREHFLRLLNANWPREDMFASFVASTEFDGICRELGFTRGTYIAPPGGMARVFVTNAYNGALNRGPTDTELIDSTNALIRAGTAINFVSSLLFSETVRSLDNEEFVKRLCRVMFDREPTETELTNWTNQLNGTLTREALFSSAVNTTEFTSLCREHGITRGTTTDPGGSGSGSGSLAGKTIVLDAGHGTSNSPGSGSYNEAVAMLDLAFRLRSLLEAQGATVVMTRTNERDVSIAARCAHINIVALEAVRANATDQSHINRINHSISVMRSIQNNPGANGNRFMNVDPFNASRRMHSELRQVFELTGVPLIRDNFLSISLHSNAVGSGGSSVTRGAEVYYISPSEFGNTRTYFDGFSNHFSRESRRFADNLLTHIDRTGIPRRSNGLRAENYAMIREINVPAVLAENGFHTNQTDRNLLSTPSFRQALAQAYLQAILQHFR